MNDMTNNFLMFGLINVQTEIFYFKKTRKHSECMYSYVNLSLTQFLKTSSY